MMRWNNECEILHDVFPCNNYLFLKKEITLYVRALYGLKTSNCLRERSMITPTGCIPFWYCVEINRSMNLTEIELILKEASICENSGRNMAL